MDQQQDNVAQLIQNLVTFRKRVPTVIYEVNNKITRKQIDHLKRIRIKLSTPDIACEIPDNIYEKIKVDNQIENMYHRNLYEQIKLLDVMKSKNSPISEIINDI